MSEKIEAKVTHRFNQNEERIFDAFLDPVLARAWMSRTVDGHTPGTIERVDIDAHEGGKFFFSQLRPEGKADAWGTYNTMERPHKLSFTWIIDPAEEADPSLVTVVILPHPDSGSVVTLTHEMGSRWSDDLQRTEIAWNTMLRQVEAELDEGQV